MKPDRRLMLAIAAAALALAAWLGLSMALIWSTLAPVQRETVAALLGPRIALLGMSWVLAVVGAAAVLRLLFQRYAHAPGRLLEATRVLLASNGVQQVIPQGSAEIQSLAGAINELAAQRDRLREDVAQQIALASRGVQQEKDRLAALMAELTESVVVCNLDGRILLYNSRARLQFRALSQAPTLAQGAELMGIGRSIYAVFDRQL
ncbi:MAG: DNA polymerase III subunit epsilon, partial [Polaromonas sp.]